MYTCPTLSRCAAVWPHGAAVRPPPRCDSLPGALSHTSMHCPTACCTRMPPSTHPPLHTPAPCHSQPAARHAARRLLALAPSAPQWADLVAPYPAVTAWMERVWSTLQPQYEQVHKMLYGVAASAGGAASRPRL